jgi:hypothetical protein
MQHRKFSAKHLVVDGWTKGLFTTTDHWPTLPLANLVSEPCYDEFEFESPAESR